MAESRQRPTAAGRCQHRRQRREHDGVRRSRAGRWSHAEEADARHVGSAITDEDKNTPTIGQTARRGPSPEGTRSCVRVSGRVYRRPAMGHDLLIPPASRNRPAPPRTRVRRWVAFSLSVLLHAAVLAKLLLIPPRPEPEGVQGEPSYDVVFADTPPPAASGEGASPPPPTEPPDPDAAEPVPPPAAPGDPSVPIPEPAPAPPVLAVPEPPVPPMAPETPTPPTPSPEQATRPTGPPQVRLSEPLLVVPPVLIPDAPSPPDPVTPPTRPSPPRPRQQAGTLDAPMDLDFGPARDRRPPPGSVASRAIDLALGPPKPGSRRAASAELRSPNAGADLMTALEHWWRRHRYYPEQARRGGEDGAVDITLRVDRHGKVEGVELRSTSGSRWLDMAALGTFRGAQLQVPTNAGETVTVDLTINYILIR